MTRTKKLLFILSTLAGSVSLLAAQQTFPAHEQDHEAKHKGRFFIGGAATYWNNAESKTISFDFCPEIGYLFNDDWGIGLLLGYEFESATLSGIKRTSNGIKISPFTRYYYLHNGPFNLYLDGGFGFNRTQEQSPLLPKSDWENGFEIGIRPGACVDLTEGLCLCLRMGFMGYRKNYSMGEEEKIGENGWGIRFAPEELMIGLELEF